MKQLFWLMSAITLAATSANAQSGRISISSANGDRQVNLVAPSQTQTLNNDELDQAINSLISASQSNSRFTQTFNSSGSFTQYQTTQANSTVAALNGSAAATAARLASRAAHGKSQGRCAMYVRKALQSAGYSFTPKPSAYQYADGTLTNAGFTQISGDNYIPQVGDVVVFNRTSKNPHGHIQIYDGGQWVSDFRQPNFSPYRQHNGYTVWRDMRPMNATATTGTMLAMNDK